MLNNDWYRYFGPTLRADTLPSPNKSGSCPSSETISAILLLDVGEMNQRKGKSSTPGCVTPYLQVPIWEPARYRILL